MSVRTLRFYDKVGLLTPAGRTESGYRLYADADLARLEQILALKFLGFSLDEIKAFLGAPAQGLREALAQQRAMLRERRARLDGVIGAVEQAERLLGTPEGDWSALVGVIRAMQQEQDTDWRTRYFTPEQLRTIEALNRAAYSDAARANLAARAPWTEEDQGRVDAQYADLYAGVRRAVAAGEAPGGDTGQALAAQAWGLIEAFTGGDPAVTAGLQRWWQEHDALPAERRPVRTPLSDAEAAFLDEAKAISRARRGA